LPDFVNEFLTQDTSRVLRKGSLASAEQLRIKHPAKKLAAFHNPLPRSVAGEIREGEQAVICQQLARKRDSGARRMLLAEAVSAAAVSRSPERSRRETSLRGTHKR
jgi:hypothetical protein